MTAPSAGFGFVYNSLMPSTEALVDSLISSLDRDGITWKSSADGIGAHESELSRTSLLVIAGGDGTVLRTVRFAARFDLPIIGVNLGKVGFMSELEVEGARDGIADYIDGRTPDAWIDERMMVRASVVRAGEEMAPESDALNEVVVSRGQTAKLLNVGASVDGAGLTTYRADGVIVSTATGSTGYAMAAGGPLMSPRVDEMLLLPVAPHMCLDKGLALPGDSEIELRIVNEADSLMSVDGFPVSRLSPGDVITVRRSPHRARFVRLRPPGDFYVGLTRRLGILDRS